MTTRDFSFDILRDGTDDPMVTILIGTPVGVLLLMAEVVISGRVITLAAAHMQGPGSKALGVGRLRAIAAVAMEKMDFYGLNIEGAVRTTGSGPGRAPKPIRFRRGRPAGDG